MDCRAADSTSSAGKGILRPMGLDQLSGKQKFSLAALLGWLAAWLIDPIITLFRLNVETLATKYGFDRIWGWPATSEFLAMIGNWIGAAYDQLTGPFGLGFVLGAVILAFWDPMARRLSHGVYGKLRIGRFYASTFIVDTLNNDKGALVLRFITHNHSPETDLTIRMTRMFLTIDGRVNPGASIDPQLVTVHADSEQEITVAAVPDLPLKAQYEGAFEIEIDYGPSPNRVRYRLSHSGSLRIILERETDRRFRAQVTKIHASTRHTKLLRKP